MTTVLREPTSFALLTGGVAAAVAISMVVLSLPSASHVSPFTGPLSFAAARPVGGAVPARLLTLGASERESIPEMSEFAHTSSFGSSGRPAGSDGISGTRGSPTPALGDIASGAAETSSLVTGTVSANVSNYGVTPTMWGVNVTIYNGTCSTSRPLPNTCPLVNWTVTNTSGEFELNLTEGDYYVAALPDPTLTGGSYPHGFGGASKSISVKGATTVHLTVYPVVPYGNTTLVLPGYTCLSRYLNDLGSGGPGCQNPVLSWTQDGAFYINASNDLVFDSFVNHTVTDLAPWTPLYQLFPDYPMIPNELFLTQDGSYLYGWGTLTPTSTVLTAEALNVTTHREFLYNFTGVTTSSVASNGQVELTGWDGNDSDLTLIAADGAIYLHDLWSSGQSNVGTLDYFEANNVYWEPFLNAYIDIQAQGSPSDGVEEWQLTGPAGYNLTKTFEGHWASGRVVNGVNGIALNATARTLSFGLGASSGGNGVVANLNGTGAITGFSTVFEGPAGALQMGPAAASDRSTLLTSSPALQGYYGGFFNGSWLLQMSDGHLGYDTTNLTGAYIYGGKTPAYDWSQWFQEGQYYNASYLIAPNSYACGRGFLEACTVNGSGGALVGTVWWYWKVGLPEFPNPPTAPMADDLPALPTDVVSAAATTSSLTLNWTNPDPTAVLNYTLAWGPTPTYSQHVSLAGDVDSDTLVGLETGTRYYFAVQAWNLHFHGASGGIASALTEGPAPPSGLAASNVGDSGVTWTWDQSTGNGIQNNTVYLFDDGTCGELLHIFSTAGPATREVVQGLDAQHGYSAIVTAWNTTGESSDSSCAAVTTLKAAPGNYSVTFTESGLSTGAFWQVEVSGGLTVPGSGSIPSVSTYLPNGTYRYLVDSVPGYRAPGPGNFSIAGRAAKVHLSFTEATYTVIFRETGLNSAWKPAWCVTFHGDGACTTNSSLRFSKIPNGTYDYIVGHVANYSLVGTSIGSVVVAGAVSGTTSNVVHLTWKLATYRVTFSETGLPTGTSWSVTLDEKTGTSKTTEVSLSVSNGTYNFSTSASGFLGAPASGNVTVSGTPVAVPVTFSPESSVPAHSILRAGGGVASVAMAIPAPRDGTSTLIRREPALSLRCR